MDQSVARARGQDESTQRLSLEEALRTIAPDLEAGGARAVQLTFGHPAIKPETAAPNKLREYRWAELGVRSRTQSATRGTELSSAYVDLLALTRWSVLMRLMGQLLDQDGIRMGVIEAETAPAESPTACQVRVTSHGRLVLTTDDVHQQLLRLRATVGARYPSPPCRMAG